MDLNNLRSELRKIGQEQVLRFWDELDEAGHKKLLAQLAALNLSHIAELVETYVKQKPPVPLPSRIEPVKAYPRFGGFGSVRTAVGREPDPPAEQEKLYRDALARGDEMLRQGKVAAFLVAGGQGTRLGYDGPKGEFPVTPVKNKPLFQVFAEQLRAYSRDFQRPIPWYIMTSDVNDGPTRDFFATHRFFGYDPKNLVFFEQGMMPAFSFDGKMLLAEKDSLALSPDGHGGSLRALDRSGALADMSKRGVEHLSYFQVDNPLVHTIDPLFLGLHDLTGSEMSSKTIPKSDPLEKVGNFIIGDGVLQVIEYSDLPESVAQQRNPDGSLKFNAGSIAIHALRVSFVQRLNARGRLELPWHRAEKKVEIVDEKGKKVKPENPNAVKLEQFVFDAIPLAKNAIVYETDRTEEFSPVKNAQGADSPETCRRDQVRRAARWLTDAGVAIEKKEGEPAAAVEISPLFAISAEQLKMRRLPFRSIKAGERLYLE